MEREAFMEMVTKALGKDAAKAVKDVFEHPELGKCLVLVGAAGARKEGVEGLTTLAQYLAGQAPEDAVPGATSKAVTGLIAGLDMDPQIVLETEDRPQVEGIVEMLYEVADSKGRWEGLLPMLRASPAELRRRAQRIGLYRGVYKSVRTLALALYSNMIAAEREGYELVKGDYDKARGYIQGHALLVGGFEKAEGYFFGAAKQGVKTARKNKADQELRAEKAQADAKVDARVAERLKSLLADDEEPTTPELKDPKGRKTPR